MVKINCDLCGKVEERLARAIIEGVELEVCQNCARFGKVVAQVKRPSAKEQHKHYIQRQKEQKEEKIEILIENYPETIKKRRESMGLTQKDFANRISEKESTIHKIETGNFEPSLALAKKLEKILGVRLIEEHEERHESFKRRKEDSFTLGDFINVKK